MAAATVTGQLTAAVVIDRLGLFGLEQTSLSATRIVGVVLLLAGTFLRRSLTEWACSSSSR